MANRKISDLTALTTTATGDLLPIVDISEAGAVDQNKKITVENLFKGIPGNVGIGTSTPGYPLDVVSDSSAWGLNIRGRSADNIAYIRFSPNSGATTYAAIGTPAANTLGFDVNGSERFRIDSSGRLLVGTSSARSTSTVNWLSQIESTGFVGLGITANDNNTGGAYLSLAKSRGTSVGSNTIVQNNDGLGYILFSGADGTDANTQAAFIGCEVDGTPGANDMPGRLVFSTTADGTASPTERMRITSGGDVFIGTQTQDGTARLTIASDVGENTIGVVASGGGSGAGYSYTAILSTGYAAYFITSAGVAGNISCSGTSTTYATSSDYRLKQAIQPIGNAITRFQLLNPVSFEWIHNSERVDGFIAHEVQEVVPEAVVGEKDAVNEDGSIKSQGIDQSKLVPLLTAALQEAIAKIETLEARLTAAGIA
jgi:hypothetical protein